MLRSYKERSIDAGRSNHQNGDTLRNCIKDCVFCNSSDMSQLSIWFTGKNDKDRNREFENDDIEKAVDYFLSKHDGGNLDRIEIITDNYGLELVSDILFGLTVLDLGVTRNVVFHTRVLPAFVSDVVVSDYGDDFERILNTIAEYETGNDVVNKFREYKTRNKKEIKSSLYWNMHYYYSDTKNYFNKIIPASDRTLVVVKGDLNFRRLLDDRDWRYEKGLKLSVLALRAIKSSLIVDMPTERANVIKNSLTGIDGRYMSIHFHEYKKSLLGKLTSGILEEPVCNNAF